MKKVIIVILVIALIVAAFFIGRKTTSSKLPQPEDIVTTTATTEEIITTTASSNTISEKELSELISEEVNRQVSEQLAEVTTVTQSNISSEATASQSQESEVSASAAPVAMPISVSTDTTVKAMHQGKEYSLKLTTDKCQAVLNNKFLKDNGRDVSVTIDANNIKAVSVSAAFIDDSDEMSAFSNFTSLEISSGETTSFSYEIPDHPSGISYTGKRMCFCAVFCIETDEHSYYVAISY